MSRFITGSEFRFSSRTGQSAGVCHTVSRLRDALNIDGAKREDFHHASLNCIKTGHRRMREIMEMTERLDEGLQHAGFCFFRLRGSSFRCSRGGLKGRL